MEKYAMLLTILLGVFSTNTYANSCPFYEVMDTEKWYLNYKVPEARMIYLTQIVDDRWLIFDNLGIVVDGRGVDLSLLKRGDSLYSMWGWYATKNERLTFTNLNGFPVEKKVWYFVPEITAYGSCKDKVLGDYR